MCLRLVGALRGEVERHWIEVTHRDVFLPGLPQAFDGFRVAQLSDIHIDDYTEPFLLRDAVVASTARTPTRYFSPATLLPAVFCREILAIASVWQCGSLLQLARVSSPLCRSRQSRRAGQPGIIKEALIESAITVLDNAYLPIERTGRPILACRRSTIPLKAGPIPNPAIPQSIRNVPHEPVVLLCHAPDYVDTLLRLPEGQAVSLMLSGHTHGGQVRVPSSIP